MLMWQGQHKRKRKTIYVSCEFDVDLGLYVIEVHMEDSLDMLKESFEPKQAPEEHMEISDLEKSVKIANKLVREIK